MSLIERLVEHHSIILEKVDAQIEILKKINKIINSHFGIKINAMGHFEKRCRHLKFYVAMDLYSISSLRIGKYFNVNNATVLRGRDRIRVQLSQGKIDIKELKQLRQLIL